MSAPVDVLAVLNRAEPIIANSDHGDAYAVLTMLPEARAAVAELIEAATPIGNFPLEDFAAYDNGADRRAIFSANDWSLTVGDIRRLRAALARATGAQA